MLRVSIQAQVLAGSPMSDHASRQVAGVLQRPAFRTDIGSGHHDGDGQARAAHSAHYVHVVVLGELVLGTVDVSAGTCDIGGAGCRRQTQAVSGGAVGVVGRPADKACNTRHNDVDWNIRSGKRLVPRDKVERMRIR